jgi:hypothetical protein
MSGVRMAIDPRYIVPTQLNTLMAVNTPDQHRDDGEGAGVQRRLPETNMWWPQAKKPTKAMPSEDMAMAL